MVDYQSMNPEELAELQRKSREEFENQMAPWYAAKAKRKLLSVGDLVKLLNTLDQDMKIILELEDDTDEPRTHNLYDTGVCLIKGGTNWYPDDQYLLLSGLVLQTKEGVTPLC